MRLAKYFDTDDGSLPEIEFEFDSPERVVSAFEYFFSCGAADVTADGGCKLWNVRLDREVPFEGPDDVRKLLTGDVESFHIVLGGISLGRPTIPDLGLLVDSSGFTIDYRMGEEWGEAQIESLILLLRELASMGGAISVPWWGQDGDSDFRTVVCGP